MAASDAFYLEIKSEVDSVLAELGTSYNVRTPGTYDPDELETVPGAPRAVTGLVADQTQQSITGAILFPVTELSGGWNAKKTLILSADANPLPGEEVQVDGKWFPLTKATPVKPADITVVYLLDISR